MEEEKNRVKDKKKTREPEQAETISTFLQGFSAPI